MISGKSWGLTVKVGDRSDEIHYIEVNPGGYCSKHKHNHKYNMFHVLEGDLTIRVWKSTYDLIDETNLESGMNTIVPPGEFHEFRSKNGCKALEMYWVEFDPDDIERLSVGGCVPDEGPVHKWSGEKSNWDTYASDSPMIDDE